jgi:hydroxypyruvate reductase
MGTLDLLRADALGIFNAALRAADPRAAVERVLMRRGDRLLLDGMPIFDFTRGRLEVLGAGKAGAPMAQAVDDIVGADDYIGAVTVKYGHVAPTRTILLYEAGHPLPDENTLRFTHSLLSFLEELTSDDLVLCLFSGGGSALMELLVDGVSLDDLRVFTNELLRCGATIYEINTLRKHISQVKGGQIARLAQPARVVSLILSDVLGSPLDVIASGPTAPDSSTFADCLAIVDRYNLRFTFPPSILRHYERGASGAIPDTPKADDPLFNRVTNVIIADNRLAVEAAAVEARGRSFEVQLLSTELQGEARELGGALGKRVRECERERGKDKKICLLGGGEPTVKLRGHGKGGRAQELVLAAAVEIAGEREIVVLSAGTDGTDGPTDAAGALADNTTIARAQALGLDAGAFLENNDAYTFFAALGDLVVTGPTNTNVNDLMIALC